MFPVAVRPGPKPYSHHMRSVHSMNCHTAAAAAIMILSLDAWYLGDGVDLGTARLSQRNLGSAVKLSI